MGTRPFLDEVPHYVVVDGIVQITAGDFALAMPLRKFEQAMVRAQVAIAKYRAEKGTVIPLRQRKRGGEH